MRRAAALALAGPRAAFAAGFVALLLALPSLSLPAVLDDHGFRHRLVVQARGPNATFCFGEASDGGWRARGPWWFTSRPASWCFFRPLSALTHWVDFRLWPDAVWWMRLETCVLYAALAALAMASYRRLSGEGPEAWLAGSMYAVNEAHAQSLSMVSGRNTLLAAALGLLTLLAHDAYRASGRRLLGALAATAFALALLAGESASATGAYLVAYALLIERSDAATRARWLSLAPYAAIALLWALSYVAGGYGTGEGHLYRDWRHAPGGTLLAGLLDLPIWLATQLSVGFATASIEAPAAPVRLVGALVTALLALVLWRTLRESGRARFYGVGFVLALLPLLLTLPQDRLLVLPSFGAFGLLGCFFARAAQTRSQRAGRAVLLAIHIGLAPLAFVPTYLLAARIGRAQDKVDSALDVYASAGQGAVIIRSPIIGSLAYALAKRRAHGQVLPRYSYELFVGPSALEITRIDSHSLELSSRTGYCTSRSECFGSDPSRFRAGQQLALAGMRVEIRELNVRRTPRRVRFHFPSPLEDPSRRWLIWTPTGVEPFTLPGLHQTVTLPALSRLDAFR